MLLSHRRDSITSDILEEEVLPIDDEIQLVTVPTNFEIQSLGNVPFIINTTDSNDAFEDDTADDNKNDILDDPNNSSMKGCVVCSIFLD